MKTKIGDIAIEFLKKRDEKYIGYSTFGLLDDVFLEAVFRKLTKEVGSRGGKLKPHPLNNHVVVLNALDRDERFRKFFINCCGSTKEAENRVREFEFRGEQNGKKQEQK